MGQAITLNGVGYLIPDTGDGGWGLAVTNYLVALSTGVLAKSGGTFTLTAEVDFGATYGLKAAYYKSRAATPVAAAGSVRLATEQIIAWRNAADDGDNVLTTDSGDNLLYNGVQVGSIALGAANTVLKVNAGGTAQEYGFLANANIDASAGIALSKLAAMTANRVPVADGSGFLAPSDMLKSGLYNMASTGLISGGSLSVNGGDNTKYDIAAGTAIFVNNYTDPTTPTYQTLSWNAMTAVSVPNIGTQIQTIIGINSAGTIVEFDFPNRATESRDIVLLGVVLHLDLATVTGIQDVASNIAIDTPANLSDLANAVGNINTAGNIYGPNGANLNIDKSAGASHLTGSNFKVNKKSPNFQTFTGQTALSFVHTWSDGAGGWNIDTPSALMDPDQYDDGSGTLQSVPNNRWTIQRIYLAGVVTVIHYGQATYSTKAAAVDAITTGIVDTNPVLTGTLLRAFVLMKKGVSDLTDDSEAVFVQASKFGDTGVSGGTTSTTDLQGAYNNSSQPQIVVTSALGGLVLEDASTPIGARLFGIDSNGGANKFFSVDANGFYYGATHDASAAIDITSTTKGLGLPNMTTAQRDAISTPKSGLKIWNTTDTAVNVYNGSEWTAVGGGLEPQTVTNADSPVTAKAGKFYYVDTSSGAVVINYPNISTQKESIGHKLVDATNTLTVNPDASDTLRGATTRVYRNEGEWAIWSAYSASEWQDYSGSLGNGVIVGKWQSYTPTTQGLGTPTLRLQYREIGESYEIKGDLTTGTTTGDEAQIGLPNGYTAKLLTSTGTVPAGTYNRDSSTSDSRETPVLITDGDTFFNFGRNSSAVTENATTPIPGSSLTSSTRISISATIPIAELANSGISVTLNDLTSRTNEVDLSVTGTNWTTTKASGYVQRDVNGKYRLIGNMLGSLSSATASLDLAIAGVVFDDTLNNNQAVATACGKGGVGFADTSGYTLDDTGTIRVNVNPGGGTATTFDDEVSVSFNVLLKEKPDFFDANAVNKTSIDAQVVKGRWQRKTLSSDATATGTLTDLGFSNLTIGKSYKVSSQIFFRQNGTSALEELTVEIKHDSSTIALSRFRQDGQSDTSTATLTPSIVFTATATTVSFDFTENSSGGVLDGNGTLAETWSMIEELLFHEDDESSDF